MYNIRANGVELLSNGIYDTFYMNLMDMDGGSQARSEAC